MMPRTLQSRWLRYVAVAVIAASAGLWGGTAARAAGDVVAVSATRDGSGYAAVDSGGVVHAFGSVRALGSPTRFTGSIVGISVTADGRGYVAVSSAGQVYAYGTVRYRANPTRFAGSIVGISATADGQGYVAVSSAGQVYAYGTVRYWGNPTGFAGSITGISATANGQGYVAVSSAAQTYSYGSVRSRGNPYDIIGIARGVSTTADGQGYAVVTTAGQIHTYGPITYRGDFGDVDNQSGSQHLWGSRYTDWNYPAGAGIYNVDQTLYVVAKAPSTYWALNWSWTSTGESGGGYMGVQTNGNRFDGTVGDTALFSLWNANGSRGGNCASFTGEGDGLSCRLAYPIYSDGNSYRLRVWRLESDAQGQWWGAWIQDSRRGDVAIGQLRVPASAREIGSANDFAEYFGGKVGCDAVPPSLVNWGFPTYRGAAANGTAAFAGSPKATCTGGTATRTTLANGTAVLHTSLGGPRRGAL